MKQTFIIDIRGSTNGIYPVIVFPSICVLCILCILLCLEAMVSTQLKQVGMD